jgi:hypothetical protein
VRAVAIAVAVIAAAAIAATTVSAQSNDLTFKQSQGDDGLVHIDIGVSYAFPGLPPRTANSGVGTVRITLPGGDFTLDPARPADPGYSCALGSMTLSGSQATCSSEGQAQGGGSAFPSSVTIHLVSKTCWASDQAGSADVWAAPTDPGAPPDVSMPIQSGQCDADAGLQPVMDTKLTCKVPNVKNVALKLAARQLTKADCARGKVTYVFSVRVRAGRVVSQSVRPGKTLKNKAKVNLVVSRGAKK